MRLLILFSVLCFSMSNITHAQSISDQKKQAMQVKERGDRGSQVQEQEQISDEARKRFAKVARQMRSGEIKFIGDKPTFRIKLNPALNFSIKELTGAKDEQEVVDKYSRISSKITKLEKSIVADALKAGIKMPYVDLIDCPDRIRFDWRALGKVTPVKNQKSCGACTMFAVLAAWEGSYAIRNDIFVDGSEQRLLSCTEGNCMYGSYLDYQRHRFTWGSSHNSSEGPGTAKEASYPYYGGISAPGTDEVCRTRIPTPYHAINTGRVNSSVDIPRVDEIKEAICEHGPIAMGMRVTSAFIYYDSGIFNEDDSGAINHAMAIVGWDDRDGGYWIVKNSWGTNWGESGYVSVAWGSNSIGKYAGFVDAPHLSIMNWEEWEKKLVAEIPSYPVSGE